MSQLELQLEPPKEEEQELLGALMEESQTNPLLEEWAEIRRHCDCELKGTFPEMKLGPVLSRILELDPADLSAVLELLYAPPTKRPLNTRRPLGITWSRTPDGRLLRVWDPDGSFAFSVEPTATKGRVLLFVYVH